jgi:hypothetical protein
VTWRLNAEIMEPDETPIRRQRLGKHVPAEATRLTVTTPTRLPESESQYSECLTNECINYSRILFMDGDVGVAASWKCMSWYWSGNMLLGTNEYIVDLLRRCSGCRSFCKIRLRPVERVYLHGSKDGGTNAAHGINSRDQLDVKISGRVSEVAHRKTHHAPFQCRFPSH